MFDVRCSTFEYLFEEVYGGRAVGAFGVADHIQSAFGSGHCDVECAQVAEVALAGGLIE